MAFETATFTPAEREDYLRLLRETWGSAAIGADEFDWWFAGPAGSLGSVARIDGRVVAAASHSFVRVAVRGSERLASFSLHAVTDAGARGRGIFAALETKNERDAEERGAAFVISVPAESAAHVFLTKLGWTSIAKLRIWARPLPRAARHVAVPRVGEFGHDGDAAVHWPENHVVRDASHLTWRYLESTRGYDVISAPDGYAVVGHKLQRGQPVAYVADLVTARPRTLLRACLSAARRGSRAMLALPGPVERRAYASLGFVPTPLTLHFMGKGLAEPLDAEAQRWRLTLGDTDFF